jgi:hypothetical protein
MIDIVAVQEDHQEHLILVVMHHQTAKEIIVAKNALIEVVGGTHVTTVTIREENV